MYNMHMQASKLFQRLLCALLILWAFAGAQAQTNPLIFSRETVTIISKQPATQPSPETPAESFEKPSQSARPEPASPASSATSNSHQFNVEVRPEDALRLDYIHALTILRDNTGVMIAFGAPTIAPLPYFRVQQATDVLFVDNEGVILQIYPGHIPIDLTQEIYADKPIKALLYLKAGAVQAFNIRPHDVVQSTVFTPPPPLLQ